MEKTHGCIKAMTDKAFTNAMVFSCAVFLLVVSVRLYQQSLSSEWDEVEASSASAAASSDQEGKEAGNCPVRTLKDKLQKNKINDNGGSKVQQLLR